MNIERHSIIFNYEIYIELGLIRRSKCEELEDEHDENEDDEVQHIRIYLLIVERFDPFEVAHQKE